jgi:hypothetical protein
MGIMNWISIGLIVLAGLIIGIQKSTIKSQEAKIESQQSTINQKEVAIQGMVTAIESQNSSILEREKKQQESQLALTNAEKERNYLRKEYAKLVGDLINKPIPKDCNESFLELRSENAKQIERWNK